MKWNAQTQQEAKNLVEALTERQWECVRGVMISLVTPPSPEQVKAQEERQEQARLQRQAMLDDYTAKHNAFQRWKAKKLKGLKMPAAYDFGMTEIEPLTDYALHEAAAGHEGYFDTLSFMYDWGFMRGMKYQEKAAASGRNADSGKREKD